MWRAQGDETLFGLRQRCRDAIIKTRHKPDKSQPTAGLRGGTAEAVAGYLEEPRKRK